MIPLVFPNRNPCLNRVLHLHRNHDNHNRAPGLSVLEETAASEFHPFILSLCTVISVLVYCLLLLLGLPLSEESWKMVSAICPSFMCIS